MMSGVAMATLSRINKYFSIDIRDTTMCVSITPIHINHTIKSSNISFSPILKYSSAHGDIQGQG